LTKFGFLDVVRNNLVLTPGRNAPGSASFNIMQVVDLAGHPALSRRIVPWIEERLEDYDAVDELGTLTLTLRNMMHTVDQHLARVLLGKLGLISFSSSSGWTEGINL
jgi:hypothetical protein